ncbi:alpha/beta fold hydrolase [Pelagibacterium limicola]|uniref:alpha/beta fold hydrolase n=1 Tax=Pelagibacterium limicola TaxID=2791022 RepID=UPI0018AFE4BF|nr:alpha/beta hydrolase [Pelagibacterium limicola]
MSELVFKNAESATAVKQAYRKVLDLWPVPRSEREIQTRHGKAFVISCGPESAPPVVLFHGSQANSAAWLPDIAAWAARFRLHAIDMIGEPGLSEHVRPELEGDTHAQWLDDVFGALELSHAGLVGTSLGGWLALDYAKRRPGFAEALVLICPAGIGRQKNFLLKALPLLLFGSWGARKVREMVFGPAPKSLPPQQQTIAGLMDMIGKAVKPRVVAIPRLSDTELRTLTIPTLAIIGARDALIDSFDTRERLRACAPQAEICFLEDGYHFLPGHTGRILEFLERNLSK